MVSVENCPVQQEMITASPCTWITCTFHCVHGDVLKHHLLHSSSPFTCLVQNPVLSYNNPHPLPFRHQEALSEWILTLDCETTKENEAQFDNDKGMHKVTAASLVINMQSFM